MENEAMLDHVADIVSAHVSNNAVAVADLPGLIQAVYASLTALGQASGLTDERTETAGFSSATTGSDACPSAVSEA
jgi:predicted transcriptional regulator